MIPPQSISVFNGADVKCFLSLNVLRLTIDSTLPVRSIFTVLLRWHLENLAFCLAFDLTSLPTSCWPRASSGPIWNIVFIFGPVPPSATSDFSIRFKEERQDLSAMPTSLPSLLFSMLAARWLLYFCFSDTTTFTGLIVLLSWCHGRLRSAVLWGIAALGTFIQCTFIMCALMPLWAILWRKHHRREILCPALCSRLHEYGLQSFKRKVNNLIMTDPWNLDRTSLD